MILDARYSSERVGCERIHSHEYSVVAAVEGGTIEMSIAGQVVDLREDQICFIPAGLAHQIISISEDFSRVHVLSLAGCFLFATGVPAVSGMLTNDKGLYLRFLQWMQIYYRAEEEEKAKLTDSILILVEQCGFCMSGKLNGQDLRSIYWVPSRIKVMIDRGADTNTCFKYIEDHIPFSKEHCNRLFKKCFGTTIQSYILSARTEKARQLLKGELPLSQLAAEAGFYDQSQLTKAFRSVFQLTPAEYRRQCSEKSRSV